MASIPGGVPVLGFMSPNDDLDTYAVIDPIYGIDGLRSVADNTERDAITAQRRREGMLVYTQDSNTYWQLAADLTTWSPFSGGSGYSDTNGFANLTDSIVTVNVGTRTLTVTPVGLSFDVYSNGTLYTHSTPQSVIWTDVEGEHYFYFDTTGTLVETTVFDPDIIKKWAITSVIYWNVPGQLIEFRAEERHGLSMDGATHAYLHQTFGAVWRSGLTLSGITVDGNGSLDAHATVTTDAGVIADEDLTFSMGPSAVYPVYYQIAAGVWRRVLAQNFPVLTTGTGRIACNDGYAQVEVTNNKFVLAHIFATNEVATPIIAVQGLLEYETINAARQGALSEITAITGLPTPEFVALGTLIYQTNDGYTNTVKGRIRSTDDGGTYVDWRQHLALKPSSTFGYEAIAELQGNTVVHEAAWGGFAG
jgi:hypothetical protein